jgi:hypothetical protein
MIESLRSIFKKEPLARGAGGAAARKQKTKALLFVKRSKNFHS